MLVRTKDLNNQEMERYKKQWESVHRYFTEMNPEKFYKLEFP